MAAQAGRPGSDHLAENVMHFARVLRSAGVPVTTDRIGLALRALSFGGLERRDDFKATLSACMVNRPEHISMFDQAFYVFWRDPDLMGRIMAMLLPKAEARAGVPPPPENRRLAAALFGPDSKPRVADESQQIEIDATLTFSREEILRKADFETMSDQEMAGREAPHGAPRDRSRAPPHKAPAARPARPQHRLAGHHESRRLERRCAGAAL